MIEIVGCWLGKLVWGERDHIGCRDQLLYMGEDNERGKADLTAIDNNGVMRGIVHAITE